MVDENNLKKEMSQWIQEKLEKNKFPCAKCKHFESSHIKGLCIGCHDIEDDLHGENRVSCYHNYVQMPNLDLIEWLADYNDKKA